jgi:UDP-N-acetylglucosamine--N-acetylmuramyl-(pentapeptide) pyrophosphoryl-undecaprenol N-acetylglucosamine transferase
MGNPIVVIMAGGTGGHIFPGLAIAKELIAHGYSVHWLGVEGGIEKNIISQHKIPMTLIKATGIRNKNIFKKIFAATNAFTSIFKIIKLFYKIQPVYVMGFGGYVTGSGGLVSRLLNIPLVIHEQNSTVGFTNKILAKFATKIFEGFKGTFPPKFADKLHTYGNPVRDEIYKITGWKMHKPCRILILGGSQGASFLNNIAVELITLYDSKINIWHQTGRNDIKKCITAYSKYGNLQVKVEEFINDIATAYQWADLVICRSGALTISELIAAGRPSILIPYPHAVDNHQYKNGAYLVHNGAAILFQQQQIDASKLIETINQLCAHPEKLEKMAIAAKKLANRNTTSLIVKSCLTLQKK